jgi:hypothetical protein
MLVAAFCPDGEQEDFDPALFDERAFVLPQAKGATSTTMSISLERGELGVRFDTMSLAQLRQNLAKQKQRFNELSAKEPRTKEVKNTSTTPGRNECNLLTW